IRSTRYYLIEKYNIDNFAPPRVYNYNLKCGKNDKIFVNFNEGQTRKRMMLRTDSKGEFYLKGLQGDYRFVRSNKFKDYGKRICTICNNLNYCENVHFIYRNTFEKRPFCRS
ncbi:3755_t:CDS:1, partial [Scutellospora calospora]